MRENVPEQGRKAFKCMWSSDLSVSGAGNRPCAVKMRVIVVTHFVGPYRKPDYS